jgi:septal ring factor EnvC (AmiA/AmiB activator)
MDKKNMVWILPVLLVLFTGGCRAGRSPFDESEEVGRTPEMIEMVNPGDTGEAPVDVAALMHDLREQSADLEKNFSGEKPELREKLRPLEQSLEDLQIKIEESSRTLTEAKEPLNSLQKKIETLRQEIQE